MENREDRASAIVVTSPVTSMIQTNGEHREQTTSQSRVKVTIWTDHMGHIGNFSNYDSVQWYENQWYYLLGNEIGGYTCGANAFSSKLNADFIETYDVKAYSREYIPLGTYRFGQNSYMHDLSIRPDLPSLMMTGYNLPYPETEDHGIMHSTLGPSFMKETIVSNIQTPVIGDR